MDGDAQAGFRKGRSCEDQITRVVQHISDGFNRSPFHRSVMVLLDFSKAYDTVWRERLLLTMIDTGVPMPLIQWLNGFLSNRRARVRFNGVNSGCRPMRQGLPQGSVLAPLLFLFYINTLAEILPPQNLNSMFADDLGIIATSRSREEAQANAQVTVNLVSEWSKEWKLNLNGSKSEVSYFSTWTQESAWEPEIIIDGKPIEYNPNPRLLGVILDRSLTFETHVAEVSRSATQSCRMLSTLANTTFGWHKHSLVPIYQSMILSKMDYAGPAWQGNTFHIDKLDKAQNKALRLITGQFKDTPLDALRAEAGVVSFQTRVNRNLLISKEKALRLDENHPRRLAYDLSIPKRLNNKRTGTHL